MGNDKISVSFALMVEGEPPAGTTFFGGVGQQPVQLIDPDGNGTYAGNLTLPADFATFPIPVAIIVGDPANPQQTIKYFGEVMLEDGDAFSASVSFKDGASGNNNDSGSGNAGGSDSGNNGGSGSGGSGSGGSSSGSGNSGGGAKAGGATAKELPRTGGKLPAFGLVGALLVGGGLLVRRATR